MEEYRKTNKNSRSNDEEATEEKEVRVKECPWCGSSKSRNRFIAGYCDSHCEEAYRNYVRHYQPAPRR